MPINTQQKNKLKETEELSKAQLKDLEDFFKERPVPEKKTEKELIDHLLAVARCRRPVIGVPKLPGPDQKTYWGIIADDFARPLTAFFRALGNEDCHELMFDFLKTPFVTARTAGVPYAAAFALGSGDWNWVLEALMAENNQRKKVVNQITSSIGPVWVKA